MNPKNTIKTVIVIDYKNPAEQFLFMQKALKVLGADIKKLKNGGIIDGGVTVKVKDRNISVFASTFKMGINIEEGITFEEIRGLTDSYFKKMNKLFDWQSVARIGVRTYWAKEYSESFDYLVKTLKSKLFQETTFINSAVDVALPLTLTNNDRKINFNVGPINREQLLRQYFEFKNAKVPSTSILIDLDYFKRQESNKNMSLSFMNDFMKEAFEYNKKIASNVWDEIKL